MCRDQYPPGCCAFQRIQVALQRAVRPQALDGEWIMNQLS